MKVLVVANNKGGQAKTTLSYLIALWMASRGKRVLAIDLDPQCNFSRRFLEMEVSSEDPEIIYPPIHPDPADVLRPSSADIFFSGNTMEYPTNFENIWIIPAEATRLIDVERVHKNEVVKEVHKYMVDFLSDPSIEEDFDFVIIDTGPSKGPLTTAGLQAATDIIIPSEMEEMPVEGIYGMMAYWNVNNLQRPSDKPLNLVGILAARVHRGKQMHQYYYDSLKNDPTIGKHMLDVIMHQAQPYSEAMMKDAKHVLELPPSNKTRQEAEQICKVIEERIYGS